MLVFLRFFFLIAGASVLFFAHGASGSTHSGSLIHGMAPTMGNGSAPRRLARKGEDLLFWASDPAHGNALHRLNLATGRSM